MTITHNEQIGRVPDQCGYIYTRVLCDGGVRLRRGQPKENHWKGDRNIADGTETPQLSTTVGFRRLFSNSSGVKEIRM